MTNYLDIHWKEQVDEFDGNQHDNADYSRTNNSDEEEHYHYHNLEFDLNGSHYEDGDGNQQGNTVKIVLRGKEKFNRSGGNHTTGLSLWICSQLVCGYLLDNPDLIRDKAVLELGAGMGLCGIVAHRLLGACTVVATDGDVQVLENLRYNIQRNACYTDDDDGNSRSIVCPQLVWGTELELFKKEYGKHKVIVGADVLYANQNILPLFDTIDSLLESDGIFILGYTPHGFVTIDKVLEVARRKGFTWTKPNVSEDNTDEEDFDCEDIPALKATCSFGYHVFLFTRQAANN